MPAGQPASPERTTPAHHRRGGVLQHRAQDRNDACETRERAHECGSLVEIERRGEGEREPVRSGRPGSMRTMRITACIAGLLVCGFRRCVCSLTGLSVNPRQVCACPEPRPDAEHAYVSNVLAWIYTSTYLICQERMSAAKPSTRPGRLRGDGLKHKGAGLELRCQPRKAGDVTGLDRGGDGLKRGPDQQLELKAELLCELAPPTELEDEQVDQPAARSIAPPQQLMVRSQDLDEAQAGLVGVGGHPLKQRATRQHQRASPARL